MPDKLFAEERKYFESHKAELLHRCPNQFVLIKGSELLGVFPDAESAYGAGIERVGLEEFLVKQVLEHDPVFFLPMVSTKPTDGRL